MLEPGLPKWQAWKAVATCDIGARGNQLMTLDIIVIGIFLSILNLCTLNVQSLFLT